MHAFIFSVTFFFIMDNSLAWSEGCNPIECFDVLDTLFHSNTEEEPCQKVTKLEKCAIVCLSISLNSSVMKGIQEVKKNLCEHEHSFKLANKCEDKHKYSFFACIYMNLHLEALEKDTNKSLLMCRQASEGQYCDRESLPFCTDRDYYLSGVILESFFKPTYLSNCFFSIGEVFDLKLKPLAYKSDYKDLAVCFDTNSPHISDCVPKKWIATNTLVDAHFTNKLCRAGDAFLSCVREMVQKKCSKLESMFSRIGQSLYQIFLPQCSKLSEISSLKISVTSDKNFNEVYGYPTTTQVSTDLQKNSSTVIVHQHMVINVNHYEINISVRNRAILILIAILFCSHFLYNMNIM